jgi:predicted phosphodiesterase
MRHRDLGDLSGPVLLFGGPYSNLQALEALVRVAHGAGIPPSHMICTGDLVAYCGAPSRCVSMMRALGCPVVAGNCEIQLGADAPGCGCGFEDGSACDLLSVGWYGPASAALSVRDRAWMAALPDIVCFTHDSARYAVVHGGATDVARFIFANAPDSFFAQEWGAVEAMVGPVDHIIAGHCGVPFIRETVKGRWINAGVIGMPPHDGECATRYAVLTGGDVEISKLEYDAKGAAADMAAAGLPDPYRLALLSGYWPSEDVLPPDLRVAPDLRSASG